MFRFSWILGVGLVVLLLCVTNGFTGGEKKDTGKAKGMLPDSWKKLNLTDEQKQKVYKIQMEAKAKIEKINEQINQVKIDERSEMLKVLSEDQKSLLRKLTLGEDTPKKDK